MNWTETKIKTVDGVELYVRYIGEGEPLLLIHGAAVDSEFYVELAETLSDKYLVITYDRRGYGQSQIKNDVHTEAEKAGTDYFKMQAADAKAVVEKITKEPVLVFGHSCGALIAAYFAMEYPDSVKKLVMEEPPVYILLKDPEIWSIIEDIKDTIRARKYNSAMNKFFLFVSGGNSSKKPLNEKEMDTFMDNSMYFIENEYLLAFDENALPKKLPEGINAILAYGRETENRPLHQATVLMAERLGIGYTVLPGGHNGAREDAEEFAVSLQELL